MIDKNKIKLIDYIDLESYKKLVEHVEWKILSDKQHQGSLDNSLFVSAVEIDGEIIALARLVGDGYVHGLLCDVIVREDYRNNHLGTLVVKDIMKKVKNSLGKDEQFLLELCPAAGKINFYLNCGFKYKPEGMAGMYLWIKEDTIIK